MKYALIRQISMGVMAAMVAVSPVFAETTPTMSQQIGVKRKTAGTEAKDKQPVLSPEAKGQASAPNRLNQRNSCPGPGSQGIPGRTGGIVPVYG